MEKMCEVCEKKSGAYSQARRLFICELCWEKLGRREAAFDRAFGEDFTGQDADCLPGEVA